MKVLYKIRENWKFFMFIGMIIFAAIGLGVSLHQQIMSRDLAEDAGVHTLIAPQVSNPLPPCTNKGGVTIDIPCKPSEAISTFTHVIGTEGKAEADKLKQDIQGKVNCQLPPGQPNIRLPDDGGVRFADGFTYLCLDGYLKVTNDPLDHQFTDGVIKVLQARIAELERRVGPPIDCSDPQYVCIDPIGPIKFHPADTAADVAHGEPLAVSNTGTLRIETDGTAMAGRGSMGVAPNGDFQFLRLDKNGNLLVTIVPEGGVPVTIVDRRIQIPEGHMPGPAEGHMTVPSISEPVPMPTKP